MRLEKKLNRLIDNTMLKPDVSMKKIERFIADSVQGAFRTVVVPQWAVSRAVKMTEGTETGVSVVIGFPLGYSPVQVKLDEIKYYLNMREGVTDFDVVVNISAIKSDMWSYVEDEIIALGNSIGDRVFKLIIETPLLEKNEIVRLSEICSSIPQLDYVKTGTGFSGKTTTEEEVLAISETLRGSKSIKVSGGVRTLSDVERFILVGGDIFGASAGVAIMDEYREFCQQM